MGKGYSLSERMKKEVAEKTGIPYEKLINMSPEEIRIKIEKKTGKPLKGWPSEAKVIEEEEMDDAFER